MRVKVSLSVKVSSGDEDVDEVGGTALEEDERLEEDALVVKFAVCFDPNREMKLLNRMEMPLTG